MNTPQKPTPRPPTGYDPPRPTQVPASNSEARKREAEKETRA